MLFKCALFFTILASILWNIKCAPDISPLNLDDALLNEYMQARTNYLKGNFIEAEDGFHSVVNKRGDFFQARFMLGKTVYLRNNLKEAEKIFYELSTQYPMYHEAQIWLVRTKIGLGKIDDAYTLLKTLLSYDGRLPPSLAPPALVHPCTSHKDKNRTLCRRKV